MTLLNFNHIFSTPTANTAITWLQGACVSLCVSLCVCGADNRLIRFSRWLKEGGKWLSAQPALCGWILPWQRGELPPYGEAPNYPPADG